MRRDEVAERAAIYWQERLEEEGGSGTQWWRAIREFTTRLGGPPAFGEVGETIAWANLFRHSYLWRSDDEAEIRAGQQSGRAKEQQDPGFSLLRDEIQAIRPDLIVMFTPGDNRAWTGMTKALAIASLEGRDPNEDYWYEKVGGRNVCVWHDESEPKSLVRPIVVRAGHPRLMQRPAFEKSIEYAALYLELTRR